MRGADHVETGVREPCMILIGPEHELAEIQTLFARRAIVDKCRESLAENLSVRKIGGDSKLEKSGIDQLKMRSLTRSFRLPDFDRSSFGDIATTRSRHWGAMTNRQ